MRIEVGGWKPEVVERKQLDLEELLRAAQTMLQPTRGKAWSSCWCRRSSNP